MICKRKVGGATVRYVEFFTPEYFDDDFDPVRVDSSLTYDSPVTISGATKANPVVITANAHGFNDGDQVKIDNVEGMTNLNGLIFLVANKTVNAFELTDTAGVNINGTAFGTYLSGGEVRKMITAISGLSHLEGQVVTVQADGAIPDKTQTYTVSAGAITLANKAAVVHVGLPYTGTLQLLKLSDGSAITGQGKNRKIYLSTIRVFRSLGMRIGVDANNLAQVHFRAPNAPTGIPTPLYTGDTHEFFNSFWSKDAEFVIYQDQPLPTLILAIILRSEVEEK